MNDWWLIVATPTGMHVWHVGEHDPGWVDEVALAARALVGFPVGDQVLLGTAWNIHVAPGVPHRLLLGAVRDPAELTGIDPQVLADYRAAHLQACADETDDLLLAAARDAVAGMSEKALAALLAHPKFDQGRPR